MQILLLNFNKILIFFYYGQCKTAFWINVTVWAASGCLEGKQDSYGRMQKESN